MELGPSGPPESLKQQPALSTSIQVLEAESFGCISKWLCPCPSVSTPSPSLTYFPQFGVRCMSSMDSYLVPVLSMKLKEVAGEEDKEPKATEGQAPSGA